MGLNDARISEEQLKLERDGIWRPILSTLNEDTMQCVEFQIRYWESAGGQPEFMKRLMRNQSLASGIDNDSQVFKIIAQKKALVSRCLANWRTVILEETGNPEDPYRQASIHDPERIEIAPGQWVAYSKEAALVLISPENRKVFDALSAAANDDMAYEDYLRDVAKNLPSSSDGSSTPSESSSGTSATALNLTSS